MRLSYNNTALGLISGFNPLTTHDEHDNYKHQQKQEEEEKEDIFPTLFCPSCGYHLQSQLQGGIQNWMGLPVGVKFDPTDNEIIEHLEAKVKNDSNKLHSLIDQFIPTLEGDNGICYTHPENLPGVRKDGKIKHFFHRPSKAYTTGKRKRRKVERTEEEDGNNETRWHKTGKTRPIFVGSRGVVKGFKKILVLYTNYGRRKKPEKTNWVMHQYHLGVSEEEKDGEFVISKVFFQKQPRCSGSSNQIMMKDSSDQNISKTATIDIIDYYNPCFIKINTGTSQSKEPETETQKQEQLLITNN